MIFIIGIILGILLALLLLKPKIVGPNSSELKNYIAYSKSLNKYYKFVPTRIIF